MLSWLVLIDRGFNPIYFLIWGKPHYLSFQRIISLNKIYVYKIGDDSKVDTPVPIPNTEVKHFNGENSVSEDSKLPIFFVLKRTLSPFLFCIYNNL